MTILSEWLDEDSDTDAPKSTRGSRGQAVGTVVFLFAFCAYLTRDEFFHPSSVPLLSTNVLTVPLFNMWTIGWNADRAVSGFQNYWQAPIFFPASDAFAFSEPQPATLLLAPVLWVTGSELMAYKVWIFLSLLLNGLAAVLLLKRMEYSRFVQLTGAVAVILIPLVHHYRDVIQLMPLWGILWFWSSAFCLAKRPCRKTVLETGVSFATCFALCVHQALFLSLLIPFSMFVFVPLLTDRRFLAASTAATVIGVLSVLPIVLPIRAAVSTNQFQRSEKLVRQMSARPQHYLASPPNALLSFRRFQAPDDRRLCVGWIRVILAAVGVGYGILRGRRKRWILFLLLTVVFAFVFSLGLNLQVGEWKPWQTLCDHLPGFRQVRSVLRFAWFVQLAIVLLALEGLTAMIVLCSRWRHQSLHRVMLTVYIAAGLLTACEVWPETPMRGEVPNLQQHLHWTEFIRDNTDAGRSVACFPFPPGGKIEDFETTTQWMYYGLRHDVPMVNGYSGFFPTQYVDLQRLVNSGFPSKQALEKLVDFHVQHIVVDRSYCASQKLLALSSETVRLELVLEDPVGIDVYRLSNSQ